MSIVDVKDTIQLVELPPVPDWFHRELEDIERIDGRPLFKCVDGQREMAFRNGKMDVKHLLQTDDYPCYVKIERIKYRRKYAKGGYEYYDSRAAAESDKRPGLFRLIEYNVSPEVRAVGRPCWVIEAFIPPGTESLATWNALRYQYLQNHAGILTKIDMHGPYPAEGRYTYCLDVIDKEGNAIAPHRRLLDELKRRRWLYEHDRKSLEECIRDDFEAIEKFEKKALKQVTDNFFQEQAFSGRRMYHAEIAKPILSVKE